MNNNLSVKVFFSVIGIVIFAIGILLTLIQMNNNRIEILEGRIYVLVEKAGDTNLKVGTIEGKMDTLLNTIIDLKEVTYKNGQ